MEENDKTSLERGYTKCPLMKSYVLLAVDDSSRSIYESCRSYKTGTPIKSISNCRRKVGANAVYDLRFKEEKVKGKIIPYIGPKERRSLSLLEKANVVKAIGSALGLVAVISGLSIPTKKKRDD